MHKNFLHNLAQISVTSSSGQAVNDFIKEICAFFCLNSAFLFEYLPSSQHICLVGRWNDTPYDNWKMRQPVHSPLLRAMLESSGFASIFTPKGTASLAAAIAGLAPEPAATAVALPVDCSEAGEFGILFRSSRPVDWNSEKRKLLAEAVELLVTLLSKDILAEKLRLRREEDDFLNGLHNVVFRYTSINEEILLGIAPLIFERWNLSRILLYSLSDNNNHLDIFYDIELLPPQNAFLGLNCRFAPPKSLDVRALPHIRALFGMREMALSCDVAEFEEADREFMAGLKARAFLKLSLGTVNTNLLRIVFIDTDGVHFWSEDEISGLGRCARIFLGLMVRLNARNALESTVKINALVKSIYEIAITSEDRSNVLPDILRAACEHYNLDRAFIFRISQDLPLLNNTPVCSYYAERIRHFHPFEPDQELITLGAGHKKLHIYSVDDPDCRNTIYYDVMKRHGVVCSCLIPLHFEDKYEGFLVFDSVTDPIVWDSGKIAVLSDIARIVAHEVMHEEHHKGLAFTSGLYNQAITSGDVIGSINSLLGKIRRESRADDVFLVDVCERGNCMYSNLPESFSCPSRNCKDSPFGFLRYATGKNGLFICNDVNDIDSEAMEEMREHGISAYVAVQFSLADGQRSFLVAARKGGRHNWTYREISSLSSYGAAIGSLWHRVAGEYARRGKLADEEFINATYSLATSEGVGAALAASILEKTSTYLAIQRAAIYDVIDQDRVALVLEHETEGFRGPEERNYAIYTGRIASLFADVSAGRASNCSDTRKLGMLEREFYQSVNVGSYYAVPLFSFGRPRHFIAAGYSDTGRSWTEREKNIFESVAHILEVTFMRKEMEERLSREKSQQLADQKLINEIYAMFAIKGDTPQTIVEAMGRLCSELKMHRMRVYSHAGPETRRFDCKHFYSFDDLPPFDGMLPPSVAARLFSASGWDGEAIYCPDITTLSQEEQDYFRPRGVRGFCSYGLQSMNGDQSYIAIFSVGRVMEWGEREINLYRNVAHIISDTIARADIEYAIAVGKRQAIAGVYREISNAKSTYEMMRRALSSIRKVIQFDRVSVYEVPYRENVEHERAYLSYYDFDRAKKASAPIDWLFVNDIARLERGVSTDVGLLQLIENNIDKYDEYRPGMRIPKNFAVAPIYSGGRILGAICFSDFSEGRELSRQDMVNLEIAVHVVETAMERKRTEEFIFYRAYYDSLLDIPNRLSAEKYLCALLESCKDGCLALIDLDDFKSINELAGYTVGDALLKELCAFLQKITTGKGKIFRFGGDEFLIVYEGITPEILQEDLSAIVERCRAVWCARNEYHYCTASIGTVFFPEYGVVAENLLESAAIAMHNAKGHGKNKISNFSISLTENLRRQYDIEQALRSALENNFRDFQVYFQPIIEAKKCKVRGCEALLRFYNKKIGALPADALISVAERLRVISAIGDYVMRKAFAACRHWHDLGHEFIVNINVSVVQFQHGDLLESVVAALRDTGCDPRWVVLEITETIAMREVDKILRIVSKLRDMGIRIALDDFGSGYFSFSTLNSIPLDVIKIDQTFTRYIDTDDFSRNFVRSIVTLAHSNGKRVCVEGVETTAQDMLVKKMGVDYIQGYLYSRPLPENEIPLMLEDGRADFNTALCLLPGDEYESYDEMQMLRNQLRTKSQQAESILRSADGFVFEYRPDSRHMQIIYMPGGWKIAGMDSGAFARHAEIEPDVFGSHVHTDDLRLFWLELERSRDNPGDSRESLVRIRASGAGYIWTAMRLSTFYDNELGCYRTIAVCSNINQQIRLQKEFEAHGKRFRSLLEATDSFIWEVREDNGNGFNILARPGSWVSDEDRVCNFDCMGTSIVDVDSRTSLVHSDDLPQALSTLRKAFETPYKRYEIMLRMRVFDDEYRLVMSKMITYHTADGTLCCIGNSMDVTDALCVDESGKIFLPPHHSIS